MELPSQSLVSVGLSTITFVATQAGPYVVEGKISLPTINTDTSNSAVVATGKKNGSTIYTGVAGAEGFRFDVTCALNDTIQVVLSSAAAVDQPVNAIKSTIVFTPGV